MHNFSLHQNLLHRHKRIPLFSQFINDCKCCFYGGFRRIMQQNDIIFSDLIDHSFCDHPGIVCRPVFRINVPQYLNHFCLIIKIAFPAAIRWSYVLRVFPGDIIDSRVCLIHLLELAVGKVLSLSVIGLLGGVSSFIGTMLALPNLMGGAALEDDSMTGAMSAAVYSGTDYVLLLFVILSTVLVIIGAISLMSGLAKSVKEAGTMVSPLMIVVMLIGVSTMFGDGAPKEVYWYLIPFYNSVQCMNGIFSFDLVPVNFVVTIVANLLYALVMTAGLAKIFDSEKIMYS